jgi:23S rRNA pseudouridine1911/1915/1917 synthase
VRGHPRSRPGIREPHSNADQGWPPVRTSRERHSAVTTSRETAAPGCYFDHWPVLFHDNHLLALYKPAGLLVQGDATADVSLLELGKAWLKAQHRKPGRVFLGLVHRLDRPVAGVVLFARTSKAAARLSEQFRSGTVEKRYLAIVEGTLQQPTGRWIDCLEREDRASRVVAAPRAGSREARLSYQVLATHGNLSLVEIALETGRRHQIRVQFAHRGHPLLGDRRYGTTAALERKQIALLAASLSFEHPVQHHRLTLASPLPRGWPWPGTITDSTNPPWTWEEES